MPQPRLSVPMPPDWLAAIAVVAVNRGKTVSEFVRDTIRSKLPADVRAGLSEMPRSGRPRKDEKSEDEI